MSHSSLQIAILAVVALVVLFVGWKAGRRWRKEYAGAVRHRQDLENTVKTQAEALAGLQASVSAQGGSSVVVIGDGSSGSAGGDERAPGLVSRRGAELRAPDAARGRLDSGPVVRSELMTAAEVAERVARRR